MANANTATAEERARAQAFSAETRQQQKAASEFSGTPEILPRGGDNAAALRMPRYGLNEREQQTANRENLRQGRTAQSVAQGTGRTAQVAGAAMEAGGAAAQGAGKATEFAGRGVEAAGRGMSVGGRAMMRAGAGLSSTGIGAIAGVPLAAAGGLVAGAGAVTQGAGKVAGAVGKGVEHGGRATRGAGRETRQLGGQVRQASSLMPAGMSGGAASRLGAGGVPNAAGALSAVSRSVGAAAQRLSKNMALPGGGVAGGLAQKIADIFQDIVELVGTSITVIGILYAIPKLHHRLIWGNLLGGIFLPAKPMAAPTFWAVVAVLLDVVLGVALLFLFFLLYAIINPCEIFADMVLPDLFSFVRSTMIEHCPNSLIEKVIQVTQ